MEYTIYVDSKSMSRLYFITLDSMFDYINKYPDDVTAGYIGIA